MTVSAIPTEKLAVPQQVVSEDPFSGLRVAITGGTSGLGLALVRELLSRGARVAFVARTPERVEQVARENPGAHGIVGDVSAKNDIYPMAIQITGELGGLDVLINNASITWTNAACHCSLTLSAKISNTSSLQTLLVHSG